MNATGTIDVIVDHLCELCDRVVASEGYPLMLIARSCDLGDQTQSRPVDLPLLECASAAWEIEQAAVHGGQRLKLARRQTEAFPRVVAQSREAQVVVGTAIEERRGELPDLEPRDRLLLGELSQEAVEELGGLVTVDVAPVVGGERLEEFWWNRQRACRQCRNRFGGG